MRWYVPGASHEPVQTLKSLALSKKHLHWESDSMRLPAALVDCVHYNAQAA